MGSEQWSKIRTKVRRRARGYCERCKVGKREDIHHLTYERLGHERLDDLIAVCGPCHEWLHGKRSADPAATTYTPEETRILRFYEAHPDMVAFDRKYRLLPTEILEKRAQSIGMPL